MGRRFARDATLGTPLTWDLSLHSWFRGGRARGRDALPAAAVDQPGATPAVLLTGRGVGEQAGQDTDGRRVRGRSQTRREFAADQRLVADQLVVGRPAQRGGHPDGAAPRRPSPPR